MQLGALLGTAGAARTEISIPAPGRFYSLLPLTLVVSASLWCVSRPQRDSNVPPGRGNLWMQ